MYTGKQARRAGMPLWHWSARANNRVIVKNNCKQLAKNLKITGKVNSNLFLKNHKLT
jgi:hypothetical protein